MVKKSIIGRIRRPSNIGDIGGIISGSISNMDHFLKRSERYTLIVMDARICHDDLYNAGGGHCEISRENGWPIQRTSLKKEEGMTPAVLSDHSMEVFDISIG